MIGILNWLCAIFLWFTSIALVYSLVTEPLESQKRQLAIFVYMFGTAFVLAGVLLVI